MTLDLALLSNRELIELRNHADPTVDPYTAEVIKRLKGALRYIDAIRKKDVDDCNILAGFLEKLSTIT